MRNRENDKFDSGRTHPGIYKNKECVLPLSTRQRDYTSKIARTLFRVSRIFAKFVWQIFKAGCTTKYIYTQRTTVSVPSSELGLPTPSPASLTGRGESQFRRLEKRLNTLSTVYSVGCLKIREKYIKGVLRIGLDYRCIQPVSRKNHICVIPVSNF